MQKRLLILLLLVLPMVTWGQVIDVPKAGKYEYVEDSIPPEPPDSIPPVVPFVNIDNAVKGTQGYQHNYSTGWTDGASDMWFGKTLTYTANGSVTFKFNGTAIEWYTEVGPTHGIVAVSIDGGVEENVDLYAPVFKQQVKMKRIVTTQAAHTIKLRTTGLKNANSTGVYLLTDYFKVDNNKPVPDTPIPPIPSGDIIVQPGQDMKGPIESATAGKTVQLLAGNYTANIVNVPVGVTIIGAGIDKTFIDFTGIHPQQSETAVFQFKSGSRVNGNQSISGFTLRGKFQGNGGVFTANRDNVKVLNVKVIETTFAGIWIKSCTGCEVAYSETYNSSWASVGWVSGELCIMDLTDCKIHHNYFHSDRNDKGYAIKALWGQSTLTRLKIYSNNEKMAKRSLWNNGSAPNIGFELHDTYYAGIEIYDNDISNVLSLASHKPTKGGKTTVTNNRFKMGGSYAIELVLSDILVEGNIFTETSIMTANYAANGKWLNQVINNNEFISNNANPSWGGIFLIGPDGANMLVTNNRITKTTAYPLVKYMGSSATSTIAVSGNTITPPATQMTSTMDKTLSISIWVILFALIFFLAGKVMDYLNVPEKTQKLVKILIIAAVVLLILVIMFGPGDKFPVIV